MKLKRYFQTAFFCVSCLACTWAHSSAQALSCKNVISTITELSEAVTKGGQFSKSKEHRNLFQLYRVQSLRANDTKKTLEDVMNITGEYPELSKPALRERSLILEQRHYEPPQSLREVVQRLKDSADQFQASFFQPEANIGFWQRLLMPLKKEELTGLSNQEKKAKQKEHKAQFREYFDQMLTPEDHEILQNTSMKVLQKTIAVYRILERIRGQMIEEGRGVQALSQAMVDLVHTSGFRNLHYINQLKSQNALEQIKGLKQILKERDTIALELNFEGLFSELIHSLNVDHPTGSTKNENLSQIVLDIQREIQNSSYTVEDQQVFRVRALSLQESPFRGCLGGDCSTRDYFDLALDPNFIYFTLTNEEMQSSGQITVVLGKAGSKKEERRIKTAFVDKIQGLPQAVILPMLEAVRLSVEELGYRLALPVDVGDNIHGLVNSSAVKAYIDSEVNPLFTHSLKNFKPHKNQYDFDPRYSRAYSKPELLEFERQEGDFKIEAGEIYTGSKIPEDLKVEDLIQEIVSLKDSDKEEDQIQFINYLKSLIEVSALSRNFGIDYLKSKIKDRQVSFKVRKKALYTLVSLGEVRTKTLHWVTDYFSENEQMALVGEISNWVDSNENYKTDFISSFVYEFLDKYIGENVQFSFQSIIFNILSKDIEIIRSVVSIAVKNEKVINYLLEDITLDSFNKLSSFTRRELLPYLNQRLFQQITGRELSDEYYSDSSILETYGNWLTLRQFQTTWNYDDVVKEMMAPYLAPKLNQAEIQSLEGEDLEILLPHLTNKQKEWVDVEKFKEILWLGKKELLPYLSQRLFQSISGEDLSILLPYLTSEQKNWVTLKQFQIPYAFTFGEEVAPYLAPKLSQAEIQSLEREFLEVLFPYLKSEQKEWITLKQFQTLPYYRDEFKEEMAPYLALRLSKTEVESLEGEDLEILLPHLTSEQKEWVDVEKFKEILWSGKKELLPYLSQRLFQSITGRELSDEYNSNSSILETYKNWITLKQFQTLPYYRDELKEEMAPYLAPRLSKTEVESLEGRDLEIILPHLTGEQKNWVTLKQF